MKIIVHSGTALPQLLAVQAGMFAARAQGAAAGVFYPEGFGGVGQGDLAVAALPITAPHPLATARGLADPVDHQDFTLRTKAALGRMITTLRPRVMLLSLPEAGLHFGADDLRALRAFLGQFADDIRVVLHMAAGADALADLVTGQAMLGATGMGTADADPQARVAQWVAAFGADAVLARQVEDDAGAQMLADLALPFAVTPAPVQIARPSRATLARLWRVNAVLRDMESALGPIPAPLRAEVLRAADAGGPPLTAADLAGLAPDAGFDPAPLLADLPARLAEWRAKSDAARAAQRTPARAAKKGPEPLSPAAEAILSPTARDVLKTFAGGRFWPRNEGVVTFDETELRPPFEVGPVPPTGALVLGCMKNEGPYILEWIAYHKAIGIDHFLIFTNDCSDGTDDILNRLAEMGHVTHVNNDEWKGKSPQQAALNKAMKMDMVKRAEWLIHIDVDEFINVRLGGGTMGELFAAMGPATNLAMTWRMFGNAGLDGIEDASVIRRFTGCSPAYCPKPHTIWGFKSITRNIGAYDKLSCHRPNQLDKGMADRVKWLNGSLKDATKELADKGWRNSIQSIGFDAVQLNHYALRSRESFLIKRQRGRALHVDRSIGLNYWVRHDWSRNTDRTILRQIPRMEVVKAQLLADPRLAELQARALDWHHAKAAELRATEAFAELWEQTRQADLTDAERMAYAVAEDMES